MEVKVYTTSTCPWCVRVKDYLNQKNVTFQEINVEGNREAAIEMIEKSKQRGVPVLDINGNIVVGFDQASIDELLNL